MKIRKAAGALLLGGTMMLAVAGEARASSHREAPFITRHPKVDGTDLYFFRSYEAGRQDFVTIVANYYPLQDAAGGPNFYSLDPDALYEIHLDNNGDGREDLTFQFRFRNELAAQGGGLKLAVGPAGAQKQIAVPLLNLGKVSATDTTALNVSETYTLKVVSGERRNGSAEAVVRADTNAVTFRKPLDNVGRATLPGYDAYAAAHIYPIKLPGCAQSGKVFVGQRKDPFAVNLGQIFDLVNFNPLGAADQGLDTLANKNVTSLVLELPIACIAPGAQKTVGAWTTASLRQARVLNPAASFARPSVEGGAWTQVSRVGNPLVNELVIGLPDKDKFNGSHPSADAQFLDYVTHPALPVIVELLYGAAGARAPAVFPRVDLVAFLLTGFDGFNANGAVAEYVRLDTRRAATPRASQNRLGATACLANGTLNVSAVGCDLAGFPNGRRPGDDVTDIVLRVAMGSLLGSDGPASRSWPYSDGANVDASKFSDVFPYLTTPVAGSVTPDNRGQ